MSDKKTVSWGWIIVLTLLFWPLGIIILSKKLNTEKIYSKKNSVITKRISYVLMGISAVYFIMIIADDSKTLFSALLFGSGGIWINQIAKKLKIESMKFEKYTNLVVDQSITKLDVVASILGSNYDVVKKELQEMVDFDFFTDTYIDEGNREIIFPNNKMYHQSDEAFTTKIVVCDSCGAKNTVTVGQINECDYCDSYIG